MTKGYITSLSRSPGDQYTWLSSLTEFPPNTRAKGWPGTKPETLDALEGYLQTHRTAHSPPLTHSRSLIQSLPPTFHLTRTRVQTLKWPTVVCFPGLLFIFMCVWGFYTSLKARPDTQSGIFGFECFLFSLLGRPWYLQG